MKAFADVVNAEFIFRQNSAESDTTCASMNFFEVVGIDVMDYPARSSDLNPIEHCCDMLGRHV